ncbi:MAG TPA: adenylate/guanylate cyclase domain-containing protein [Candidatus Sulfopaludibacter sp.]|jgi:adenylate cyclase|nr:adenylate/guanylate cyclase domain-containing protein [Candidatus Sulfopaludibacter sp.]
MSDKVDQRITILNLYNSGIDPETISLELDINQDTVIKVINGETTKEQEKRANNKGNNLLNRVYLDAVIDINTIIKDSQIRIWKALKAKPDYNTSFQETQNILERYGESKINLIILHIDLVGSTRMSLNLPIDRLTTIIRTFAQQMSIIISMYGGFVLKYIGDAVLAFFIVEDIKDTKISTDLIIENKDNKNSYCLQYSNAISSAHTMIKVVKEGINPILNQYDYPELKVRIGIDFGEIAIVQYGWDIDEYKGLVLKKPHLDLIGYTISIAVKMTTLAKSDHIVIGQKLFDKLNIKEKEIFKKLPVVSEIWDYMHKTTGRIYDLYENI